MQYFVKESRSELWNLESFVENFREMDSLYSIGTCLVIVTINVPVVLWRGL